VENLFTHRVHRTLFCESVSLRGKTARLEVLKAVFHGMWVVWNVSLSLGQWLPAF
jgi:hypothetical protein